VTGTIEKICLSDTTLLKGTNSDGMFIVHYTPFKSFPFFVKQHIVQIKVNPRSKSFIKPLNSSFTKLVKAGISSETCQCLNIAQGNFVGAIVCNAGGDYCWQCCFSIGQLH